MVGFRTVPDGQRVSDKLQVDRQFQLQWLRVQLLFCFCTLVFRNEYISLAQPTIKSILK